MKNEKVVKFLSQHKAKPYKPSFKEGDFIALEFNGKRIITEVKYIILYDKPRKVWNMYRNKEYFSIGEYGLLDVVNEFSTAKKFYSRKRNIEGIDANYKLVKKETVRILYGIKK